jgi:hypothetical protein
MNTFFTLMIVFVGFAKTTSAFVMPPHQCKSVFGVQSAQMGPPTVTSQLASSKEEGMNYPSREDVKKAIANEAAKAKAPAGGADLQVGSWIGCAACKAGLNIAVAGPIAVAIATFPENAAVIATIAVACGISEAAVLGIIAGAVAGGASSVEDVISKLCKEMGAC